MWTGTGDDWVGSSDAPTKTRGNVVDGVFTQLSSANLRSKVLRVTSGSEGVYMYTTSNIGDFSINNCCSFGNSFNQNPRTANIVQTNDGSYALYLRFQDLAPQGSESFSWYYAAGATADLATLLTNLDSAAKPGAPAVSAVNAGDSEASVVFTAGTSGGSTITNYEYSTNGGSSWVARSPAATSSPLVITGLTNGTSYSVRIRAVNSEGSGTASSATSITPIGTPEAPTITALTPGETNISIAFDANGTGGAAISNYQYSLNGGSTWVTRSPVSTVSPLNITGLTAGTSYAVALRAINFEGNGEATSSQTVATGGAPSAPSISLITALDRSLSIAFAENSMGCNICISAAHKRIDFTVPDVIETKIMEVFDYKGK
jgi:hypothetical protein